MHNKRPDFVIFLADQHRADLLGYAGDPLLPMDEVTFVELLSDVGYATVLVGKSHLHNNTRLPPRLERRDWDDPETRVTLPFYGFEQVELDAGHGNRVEGNYMAWVPSKGADVRTLRGPQHALPHNDSCPQVWRTAVPEELYPSAYITEKSREVIDRLVQQDQPFFLLVSFPDPHHPFTPPGRYWDMYRAEDIPSEPSYADADWPVPPHVQAVFDKRARAKGSSTLPEPLAGPVHLV